MKDIFDSPRVPAESLRPLILVVLGLFILTGWGSTGHKIINRAGAVELPVEMQGFIQRAAMLADSASNADNRKGRDPSESPKHFIDIDDYPEFFSRSVPHSLDSLILRYGLQRVTTNGLLPWAISTSVDTLTAQMQRGAWNRAWSTAADVGHYVADAHQPLHCTANYDGQLTNNRGIHSRYESSMVDRYQQSILLRAGQVIYVASPIDFAFEVIYRSYVYCDSILQADNYAKLVSGWSGSGQEPAEYYSAMWTRAGGFTSVVMQRAADAFASLLYTAWVRAGKPSIPLTTGTADVNRNSGRSPETGPNSFLSQNYPNPFNPSTTVSYMLPERAFVTLWIVNDLGQKVALLVNEVQNAGYHRERWHSSNHPSGIYFYRLRVGTFIETKKMLLIR